MGPSYQSVLSSVCIPVPFSCQANLDQIWGNGSLKLWGPAILKSFYSAPIHLIRSTVDSIPTVYPNLSARFHQWWTKNLRRRQDPGVKN